MFNFTLKSTETTGFWKPSNWKQTVTNCVGDSANEDVWRDDLMKRRWQSEPWRHCQMTSLTHALSYDHLSTCQQLTSFFWSISWLASHANRTAVLHVDEFICLVLLSFCSKNSCLCECNDVLKLNFYLSETNVCFDGPFERKIAF